MKKLLAMLMIAAICLGLFACSNESANTDSTKPSQNNSANTADPNAIAIEIGGRKVSVLEMNYFYVDSINQWYNQYGMYASYFGLSASVGLDQQVYDQEKGTTWADYFMDQAIETAKSIYTVYDAAQNADYALSDDEKASLDALYTSLEQQATSAKKTVDQYLQGVYGESATEKSYKAYFEIKILASSYYNHYSEELAASYSDADLRAFEGDTPYNYNSYTYASFYMPLDTFKMGGTKDIDNKITYSDEEIQLAKEYLTHFKTQLSDGSINTVAKLNLAIAWMEDEVEKLESKPSVESLPVYSADNTEHSDDKKHSTATESTATLYSKVSAVMQEWLRDEARQPGDITAIAYESGEGDSKTLAGYYIVLFQECTDNSFPLANIRHILVMFEGGSYDSTTGQTTYSAEEKNAAKTQAEKLYQQWLDGEATEDSFAAMANKHSDDGDGTTGGLYEDVYPGQMVPNFNNWCFDKNRQAGDHGIVETEYGYHIMFYPGHSDQTYRNYMVSNDKLGKEMGTWLENLVASVTVKEIAMDLINKDLILNNLSA